MREQPPKSKLAAAMERQNARQGGDAVALDEHRFAKAIAGARPREPFTIPRLNLPAVMTLVPHHRVAQIEADVIETMERKLRIPLNATTEIDYEAERAARTLAEAVIDPDTINADGSGDWRPLGDVSLWRQLDQDVIGYCWSVQTDVRVAYDPVSLDISQEEIDAIEEIVKKNTAPREVRLKLLRTLGVRRLSSYLLSTASPPSESMTPESSSGLSASD